MTLEQRHQAIGMMAAGMPGNEVARQLNIAESTVSRLKTRHQLTGSVKDRPRVGRPRKTSRREDNFIVTSSRRDRFQSAPKLAVRLREST